jgi:hypothetical protein
MYVNHPWRTAYGILYESQSKLCPRSAQITDRDAAIFPPAGLWGAGVYDDALTAARLRLGQFHHAPFDGAAEPGRQRQAGRPYMDDHRRDLQDTCATARAQSQGTNARNVSGNHDVDAVAN